jgi:hypothetical protein
VSHLVTAFVLIFAVTSGVAIGVGTGFFIISAILNAFAHKPQQPSSAAAVLVAQGVTGD